ncbi:hypothetical protein [Sphingomonas sp. Root710]|uniref:hypothetical protein n=1 Tax=Sphingomonas sp. Root710 TaxID=1736594 RepID=UPI000B24D591|nr:hypothetical protein [Sphingomonas sp. Root710]
MIDEWEIWACANQLMQQYGDAASFHAAQRADDLFAANDMDGHLTWLRILKRIENLEDLDPQSSLQ